jgi:formamidopyrimidine-DNA glycosylase
MPELPEVEAVRRLLQPAMEGSRFEEVITHRPNLRVPFTADFVERLLGHTVLRVERRGKYLVLALSSGDALVMHLGMSGWFKVNPEVGEPHDHVTFRMSSGAIIVFNDPRRFGFMRVEAADAPGHTGGVAALGVEPLSAAFDAASLARACRGRKTSLKSALADQRVVAGLGNIYVSEALHRAGLSPRRRAGSIATASGRPRPTAVRLVQAIRDVLRDAIEHGDDNRFRVYDREGRRCVRRGCRGIIRRIVQSGRSTFFCPACQR